jgi:benzoyl-CoA 2,3-dioxygenase component B
VRRWNKIVAKAGIDFEFSLPHPRFHRKMGLFANMPFDTEGNWIGEDRWEARKDEFLPTAADQAYVAAIQKPCYEIGKIASWISPPKIGINKNSFDFEYVKFDSDPYARL